MPFLSPNQQCQSTERRRPGLGVAVKPFNLAALEFGDFMREITFAPCILAILRLAHNILL